jgi:hypothetical protein
MESSEAVQIGAVQIGGLQACLLKKMVGFGAEDEVKDNDKVKLIFTTTVTIFLSILQNSKRGLASTNTPLSSLLPIIICLCNRRFQEPIQCFTSLKHTCWVELGRDLKKPIIKSIKKMNTYC